MKRNRHATAALAKPAWAKRAWCALAAIVLAAACAIVAPSAAWASDDADSTATVGLTIYDTTDNTTVYNDAVTVSADATVADVLVEAGFTEASTLADTADGVSYYDSLSCPYFLAKGYDSSTYCYWVAMYEGDGWNNYADAYLTATVQDGGHYQYIYGTSSYFDYDDYGLTDPLATTEDTDDGEDGDEDEDGDEESTVVNAYDAEAVATLIENLTARFSDGGTDDAITNSTLDAALALNALGLGSQIDADAVLANLETDYDDMAAGTLAKYIMALTAAGVDCTAVTFSDGTTVDLVAEMEARAVESTPNVYSAIYVLAVYEAGDYTVGDDALSIDELIDIIVSSIDADTGLAGITGYADTQTSAQAILALVAYADDEDVAAAIEALVAGILANQNDDGGFVYMSAYSTDSDVDTTATVVAAFVALGYDVVSDLATASGSDPIGYLVSQADSTLDGYVDSDAADEVMRSASVFLALAAYSVSSDSGEAYNVYGLQTVTASSDDGDDADEEDAEEEDDSADADADEESDDETSEGTLAQTGDDASAAGAAAAAAALGALATLLAAACRVRKASEPEVALRR